MSAFFLRVSVGAILCKMHIVLIFSFLSIQGFYLSLFSKPLFPYKNILGGLLQYFQQISFRVKLNRLGNFQGKLLYLNIGCEKNDLVGTLLFELRNTVCKFLICSAFKISCVNKLWIEEYFAFSEEKYS